MEDKLCAERHNMVNSRLDGHDKKFVAQDERFNKLERSSAVNETRIVDLTDSLEKTNKSLGRQTGAIWGLVATLLVTMIGFILSKI